jgi:hypothetical protein
MNLTFRLLRFTTKRRASLIRHDPFLE